MLDVGVGAIEGADDSDDVKAEIVDVVIAHIVVDGASQVKEFLSVYGIQRVTEIAVATRLDLHKKIEVATSGNDVDITMARPPVLFYDVVTLSKKIPFCDPFAPLAH